MKKGVMMQMRTRTVLVLVSLVLWGGTGGTAVQAQPRPPAALKLVRVEPMGQDVLLVFRVPEVLDLGGPMQLRIGDLSVNFRDVQDYNARHATFVVSRELYKAIDNRRHPTVLSSGTGRVEATIAYPPLPRAGPRY
jgi:hypothetical protein